MASPQSTPNRLSLGVWATAQRPGADHLCIIMPLAPRMTGNYWFIPTICGDFPGGWFTTLLYPDLHDFAIEPATIVQPPKTQWQIASWLRKISHITQAFGTFFSSLARALCPVRTKCGSCCCLWKHRPDIFCPLQVSSLCWSVHGCKLSPTQQALEWKTQSDGKWTPPNSMIPHHFPSFSP